MVLSFVLYCPSPGINSVLDSHDQHADHSICEGRDLKQEVLRGIQP